MYRILIHQKMQNTLVFWRGDVLCLNLNQKMAQKYFNFQMSFVSSENLKICLLNKNLTNVHFDHQFLNLK